jgi:trigger factor
LQRLGAQRIKAAALEELIQSSLEKALEQASIKSLGNYQLRSNFDELVQTYQPGQPLTFSASVDVPPTVKLGDYTALNIKAEETAYDPKSVEDWLEERRIQQATLVPVEERSAQMGDVAVIDYQGRLAAAEGEVGEPLPGVQGTDFKVELAEGRFIEGMVEGIVGMKPDEAKDIAVTFPADYPREDLAGQSAIFSITLKELKEKELPELDDDFAEEVSEFETLSELRESLEKQFKEQADKETKDSIHSAIAKALLDLCSVDLPETMIREEVNMLLTQTAMQMEQMGLDVRRLFTAENIAEMRNNARPEAIERLQQSLIIQEIAKVEAIAVDAGEIEAKVKETQQKLADRDIDLERLHTIIEEQLLAEKTLDWLQEKATIELVPKGSLEEEAEQPTEEEAESTAAPDATSEA